MKRECIRIKKKNEFNFVNDIYVRLLFRTYKIKMSTFFILILI